MYRSLSSPVARWVLLAPLLLCAASFAHAEIHRWVDDQGKVHFGDRPPPDVEASVVKLRINTYESPSIEALAEVVSGGAEVVLYSTSWCGVCRKAKAYFDTNGIAYTEYDIEKSAKGKREFDRLGGRGVPVILVGDKRLNGFSSASFKKIYARQADVEVDR
jgi:glutaredoxin